MRGQQKGCKFRHLRLLGYRGFGEEIHLRDLGDTVVLYGLNSTGKTNLLRGVRFAARLIAQPLSKLLDPAFENAKVFYERLEEDRWMFAHGSRRVELDVTIAPLEHSLRFEISSHESGINARLFVATGDGGYQFHRDHRCPGTRPMARGRFFALPVVRRRVHELAFASMKATESLPLGSAHSMESIRWNAS